jgi:hypothetical protein
MKAPHKAVTVELWLRSTAKQRAVVVVVAVVVVYHLVSSRRMAAKGAQGIPG